MLPWWIDKLSQGSPKSSPPQPEKLSLDIEVAGCLSQRIAAAHHPQDGEPERQMKSVSQSATVAVHMRVSGHHGVASLN